MSAVPLSSGGGLLLDTHAFLWVLADDSRLGPSSRAALRAGAAVYYSSVTILELTIKDMLGRLDLPGDPVAGAAAAGLTELTFTAAHASTLREFPSLVRHDPFDRMVLAQARAAGLRLVTADGVLLALDGVDLADARR